MIELKNIVLSEVHIFLHLYSFILFNQKKFRPKLINHAKRLILLFYKN